jgi:hypothetical protein
MLAAGLAGLAVAVAPAATPTAGGAPIAVGTVTFAIR